MQGGTKGGDSTFSTITSAGGGGGGGLVLYTAGGSNGGSGGGGQTTGWICRVEGNTPSVSPITRKSRWKSGKVGWLYNMMDLVVVEPVQHGGTYKWMVDIRQWWTWWCWSYNRNYRIQLQLAYAGGGGGGGNPGGGNQMEDGGGTVVVEEEVRRKPAANAGTAKITQVVVVEVDLQRLVQHQKTVEAGGSGIVIIRYKFQ